VRVTVSTGGTQGITTDNLGTLGSAETGLDYDHLRHLAIFNGGGTGSVATTLTFTNIQVGSSHLRGLLMVGAINATSSPVTVTSSVAGRVQTWTVVGTPFDLSPFNSFAVAWNPASGHITTEAASGNDSRCIVLDLGDLTTDGDVTISLSQHLNDGIVYAFGEELIGALDVPALPNGPTLGLAAPRPNPARDRVGVIFTLPERMRARIGVYDLAGRLLAQLADGEFTAGAHPIRWDMRGADGSAVPAGLCFLRMETAVGTRVQRVAVVR
jgi:hypothetical protein